MFKFVETPTANRASSKHFFASKAGTLPSAAIGVAWRYRVERVGKALKLMKPYAVTKMALSLKEKQPVEASLQSPSKQCRLLVKHNRSNMQSTTGAQQEQHAHHKL